MTDTYTITDLYEIGFKAGYEEGLKARLHQAIEKANDSGAKNRSDVLTICEEYFNLTMDEMSLRSRVRKLVIPRQITMYFLWKYTKTSLAAIGRLFGGYDHTTVLYAKDLINDLLSARDKSILTPVMAIEEVVMKKLFPEEHSTTIADYFKITDGYKPATGQ